MNKYNVKATSGYISKYKLVAMLDEARKNETSGIAYKTYEKAIEITETMDEADVASVVHGYWRDRYFHPIYASGCGECSICGKDNPCTNYCPNCGAKMDESEV